MTTEDLHDLDALASLTDRVRRQAYRVVADGTGPVGRDEVAEALGVGRTLAATFPPKEADPEGATLLSVENLGGSGFRDISFEVHRGEIVGIGGVIGNGQPALLRALAGLDSSSGTVAINGKAMSRRELFKSAAYMPADRLTEGLMTSLNVRENAALSAIGRANIL